MTVVALVLAAVQLVGAPLGAPRAVDGASLFTRGRTWEQFLKSVRRQKDEWESNAAKARVPADLTTRLTRVRGDLKMLIVTEDWCSDSVNTVPYIAKLTERVGIELRIVDRAVGAPLLERYQTPDHRIPTPLVVWISHGRDAATWIERPTALQTWFVAMRNAHDDGRMTRKEEWYRRDQGQSTLAEIVALAENLSTGAALSK